MARLISLVLQPASESKPSSMVFQQYPTPTQLSHSGTSTKRKQTTAIPKLTILPYTKDEWRRIIKDVKALFLNRLYKQCSARCVEILEGIKIKRSKQAHPLYLTYLSFLAAYSFEQVAMLLHQNSHSKLPALRQASTYYKDAERQIEITKHSSDCNTSYMSLKSRQSSVFPYASSIRSYADSTFSHTSPPASETSSGISSPALSYASDDISKNHSASSSVSSVDCLTPALHQMKKKVSFSLQIDALVANSASQRFEDDAIPRSPTLPDSPTLPLSFTRPSGVSSYLLSQTGPGYLADLKALQVQLRAHLYSVDTQITELNEVLSARQSNTVSTLAHLKSSLEGFVKEEQKKMDLTAKIAKFKENGWRRERFSGEKYESLCETVLQELAASKH